MTGEAMEFPKTFDEFARTYSIKDTEEIYSNGVEFIPVFRVKQWLEHISEKTQMIDKSNFDEEQYKTDLQSAYDCGYNKALSENKGEWIPVSERLPEEREWYLAVFKEKDTDFQLIPRVADYIGHGENKWQWIDEEGIPQEYLDLLECVAWQPLPEPYKAESEEL